MAREADATRRRFLRAAGAASLFGLTSSPMFGAEPVDCAPPSNPKPIAFVPDKSMPIIERPNASNLTAAQTASLSKAYAALRDLTKNHPSDPRGWLQQGNKHCWQCGGGTDGQAGEEIHGHWTFLPWHRAYLYFHERILQTLSGDANLRLPYWEWNNASFYGPPPAYLTPNTDPPNSLFDPIRSCKPGDKLPIKTVPGVSFDLVGPAVMNPIMGTHSFTNFGGDASNPGDLENGPHGAVHLWCGNTKYPYNSQADMGLLDTAAQDPIFFTHHGNIDRLWYVWNSSSALNKNPTASAWLNHKFQFFDQNSKLVSITVAQVLDFETNLRYKYPAAIKLGGVHLLNPAVLALDSNKVITIPDAFKNKVAEGAGANQGATLRVEGITLPSNAGGIYRILANKAGGEPVDVSYIALVPKTSQGMAHDHGRFAASIDAASLAPVLQGNNKVSLSVVPLAAGPNRGVAAAAQGTPLKFDRVYWVER